DANYLPSKEGVHQTRGGSESKSTIRMTFAIQLGARAKLRHLKWQCAIENGNRQSVNRSRSCKLDSHQRF
ncbi:hypothetical protein, partial [Mycolicibacterium sp.]|uniref:hypothetical protein n=1 Tax=Mycolicibacterium sp. TaxID=2320850 RepID=UPI0037C81979